MGSYVDKFLFFHIGQLTTVGDRSVLEGAVKKLRDEHIMLSRKIESITSVYAGDAGHGFYVCGKRLKNS